MAFTFSSRSLAELQGVHPDLVQVARRAIELTPVDFGVLDGIRTVEEQRENVAKGVSQTMNSKHLPQEDGLGHAVDLVPYVNGQYRWEMGAVHPVAAAVRTAAREFGVAIRWGGCWCRLDTTGEEAIESLVAAYVARKRDAGKRPFVDGVHYEILEV